MSPRTRLYIGAILTLAPGTALGLAVFFEVFP